jgi:hypothetical protein
MIAGRPQSSTRLPVVLAFGRHDATFIRQHRHCFLQQILIHVTHGPTSAKLVRIVGRVDFGEGVA